MSAEIPSTNAPARPPLGVLLVATALGSGLLPGAPGTWGTFLAVPLAVALDRLGALAFLVGTAVVIAAGTWAADAYCAATRKHDNQQIVVDEVAGYLVTLALVPRTLTNLVTAFILFRVFDIWKPPPVRQIDRRLKGGFGVMADDLAAAVYAGACVWAIDRFRLVERVLG